MKQLILKLDCPTDSPEDHGLADVIETISMLVFKGMYEGTAQTYDGRYYWELVNKEDYDAEPRG